MTRFSALALALLAAPTALAAVPVQLTHQGYLLDASDRPLDASSVAFSFTLFDQSAPVVSETTLWTGACTTDVFHGYYAVVLGTAGCGPTLDTDAVPPGALRFLEVHVGAVRLLPRLTIMSAPTAAVASQSLDAQALRSELAAPGTVNAPTNPVDWSQLKGVPAALADGTDDGSTYTAGAGLALLGGEFSIPTGSVTNSMLAHDAITVSNGTGLMGGGTVALGGSLTLGLAPSGVTAGTYSLPSLTIDATGRITSASSTTLSLPTTGVTAGTYSNPTITIDAQGRVTAAAAGSGGADLSVLAGISRSCNTNTGQMTFDGTHWGFCLVNADAFTLTNATNVAISTAVTSNTVTPTGFLGTGTIVLSTATGGTFTVVKNGVDTGLTTTGVTTSDTFAVRTVTGSAYLATSSVQVTLGTASATWQVTTAPEYWNCTNFPSHAGCVASSQYASCKAIKDDPLFNGSSGTFFVDPDGSGSTIAPVLAYCDMTYLTGGWTVVAHKSSAGQDILSAAANGTPATPGASAFKLSTTVIDALQAVSTQWAIRGALSGKTVLMKTTGNWGGLSANNYASLQNINSGVGMSGCGANNWSAGNFYPADNTVPNPSCFAYPTTGNFYDFKSDPYGGTGTGQDILLR